MNTQANLNESHLQQTAPDQHQGNWYAVITLSITAFVLVTSEFLPIGVLNAIAQDLQVTVGTAGLVITLPGVMGAFAAPLISVWVKGLDRRYLLIGLTAVMVIANFITAYAASFALILFSRFILGIAIGGFWATAIALSGRVAPAHLPIAKATAIVMAGVTLATVLGVPIGTWLSELYGWRTAFLMTAVIGAVILVFEYLFLPKLYPTSAIQYRDLPALFADPKARKGLVIILLIGLAHFSTYSYLAPFFKNVSGFNGATISTLLLVYGAAGFFGNAFAGYSSNLNVRYTLAAVGVCLAVVFIGFPIYATHLTGAYFLTAIWGFAFGAFPTTANIWMFLHAPQAVEKGMPLFVGIFQVMIALGALIGGFMVDHFSTSILLYSVVTLIAFALLAVFTHSRGLNNPKIIEQASTCQN
ncbi:MFS transporter [Acinetobacter shaoyimingii]|uniref:MFS transporter n=1 Tax=Acinetobacter shaoyimingii TaxID=2715164 RepID=A0A6G8RU71_9GAMM|nr:MFS transporter [Acinetobacter shaoyimingii]QIO05509.1 MFS transporter [Acinetobacter shaoyimingii]